MSRPDFNNLGHMLGGAVAAYIVIWFRRGNDDVSVTAALAMAAAFLVNMLWELSVDLIGLWPVAADPMGVDVLDIFLRGGIGGLAVCGYWLLRRR
jgi:hypothetical protein